MEREERWRGRDFFALHVMHQSLSGQLTRNLLHYKHPINVIGSKLVMGILLTYSHKAAGLAVISHHSKRSLPSAGNKCIPHHML